GPCNSHTPTRNLVARARRLSRCDPGGPLLRFDQWVVPACVGARGKASADHLPRHLGHRHTHPRRARALDPLPRPDRGRTLHGDARPLPCGGRPRLMPLAGWERALECTRAALDRKAYDLVVLETGNVSSVADYFIICSGRSDTQVQAIADGIDEHLRTR